MKLTLTLFALTLIVCQADAQCYQRRVIVDRCAPVCPPVCAPVTHCPPKVTVVEPYSFEFRPAYQQFFALPGFNLLGDYRQDFGAFQGYQQTQPVQQELLNLLPAITGTAFEVSTIPAQTQRPTRALVEQVLRARCQSCHTSPGKDNVAMFDALGRWAPTIDRNDVYRVVVQKGKMPPGQRLPSSEIEIVKAWYALGASD